MNGTAYTNTTLWKASLADHDDSNDYLRKNLRNVFEVARRNAEQILSKIRKDFPALTVHDITHVDSLWQVGSVIAGDKYELNPLEGFVLGCAFLMHDAVLSYDAAGGQTKLRETTEWQDFYADYKKDISLSSDEQLYETDFRTIRFLHAKWVTTLYSELFNRTDGSSFYIIEDENLRNHLGALVCKIAASHHWGIDDVEELGIQFTAPAGYPREWHINPMKLACIIRCADAGHIDSMRAPDYLLKLLTVNGVSKNHWIAQNRLSQIDSDITDSEKAIITSNIDFTENDFAAWNVACDAVQVLNHEIKSSNALLRKNHSQEFQIKAISGADSRQKLSQYIKTNGWFPCDANIHISNGEKLIQNLGGEKLYGSEHKLEVILRELIQNGRDAIAARRKREQSFDGKICISIENVDGNTWVTVTDNGVGMSMQTIKDYFLNFGSSFWASDLAKMEYPGLNASDFKSVGQFGIGFFAIFMIASEIIVETRKYDKGLDCNLRIKFPSGLCLRPIIANTCSIRTDVSTSVKFMIDEQKCKWTNVKEIKAGISGTNPFDVPYANVLSYITAGLDVDVYYSELGNLSQKIHTSIDSVDFDRVQWLKDITHAEYRKNTKYVKYIENNHARIRKVCYNGKICGYAALNTMYDDSFTCFDIMTIGGLANFGVRGNNSDFLGCMFTEPTTAKRDGTIASICKSNWAKEQYEILCQNGLTEEDKLHLPYIVGQYGIDMTDVMKVRVMSKSEKGIFSISLKSLLLLLRSSGMKLILPLASLLNNRLDNYVDYQRTRLLMTSDEVLFMVEKNGGFLNLDDPDSHFQFNIMHCINSLAKKYNFRINITSQDNKSVSRIEGNGNAIILTVS